MSSTGSIVSRALQFGVAFGALGAVAGVCFEQLRMRRAVRDDPEDDTQDDIEPMVVRAVAAAVPEDPAPFARVNAAPIPATLAPTQPPSAPLAPVPAPAPAPAPKAYVAPDVLRDINDVYKVPHINAKLADRLRACFATYEELTRGQDASGKTLSIGYVVNKMYETHERVIATMQAIDADIRRAIDAARFKDVRVAILEHNDRYKSNVLTANDRRASHF